MSAYLVGTLQIDTIPPQLVRVGVYSNNANGLTFLGVGSRELSIDLALYSHDHGFEQARREVLDDVRRAPWMHWVVPLLGSDDRVVYDQLVKESRG